MMAAAASTTTGKPVFLWKWDQLSEQIGMPKAATGTTAAMSCCAISNCARSGVNNQLSLSISHITGVRPTLIIASMVAEGVEVLLLLRQTCFRF